MATQVINATQLTEQKLIRAGQRGDAQAIESLFGRYHRQLFQTALRVLGNAEDAEDALQDGLLSAYRNLKRFEGRSQFSTWLTRIVINAALMKRRSAKARPAVSLDETHHEDELPAAERFADDGPTSRSTKAVRSSGESSSRFSLMISRTFAATADRFRAARSRRL